MKLTSALALMAVGSASATSFSVCSGKTDGLGISSVTFSEEPVVPGSTLTITVDATPTVAITDGATLTFDILLGAFPIMSVEKDVCKDLGVTCPLPAGVSTEISVDVDIKSSAPAASVTAEVTTTNGDGSAVSCVDIPLTVSVADKLPLTLSHEVELTTELVDNMFATFKKQFNKVYDNKEEHGMRRTHFEASLKRIQERNSVLGDSPTFGVTKFSDMSVEEFKQKMLTYKNPVAHDDISRINAETHEAVARKLRGAKSFAATATDKDWRDDGAVTDVKDQGQCGSCWAFSTTEGIESAFFLSGYELTKLSVEQLVQCDTGDAGCNGGDTISAYDYIQDAEGLATEEDYPYTSGRGVTGKCNDNFSVVEGTNIASWKYATPACTTRKCEDQDEDTLASTVSTVAPPSICVNAESWQDYTTGVLTSKSCGGNGYYALDHCVQLIGYNGISGDDGYWIVRNSWADDWGVDGMIHLEYGANTCGVADEATVVTLE